MKGIGPALILFAALVATTFSLVAGDSYATLTSLGDALDQQKDRNAQLEERVTDLREAVYSLKHDKRTLEKAARNELGMAREDELIFFFEREE